VDLLLVGAHVQVGLDADAFFGRFPGDGRGVVMFFLEKRVFYRVGFACLLPGAVLVFERVHATQLWVLLALLPEEVQRSPGSVRKRRVPGVISSELAP
jgi:hypothetical protein